MTMDNVEHMAKMIIRCKEVEAEFAVLFSAIRNQKPTIPETAVNRILRVAIRHTRSGYVKKLLALLTGLSDLEGDCTGTSRGSMSTLPWLLHRCSERYQL